MKQFFTLLVAVVLAFPTAVWATAGVSATAARFADQGTRVAGVVQDAEGSPIQGATVRAVSTTTNTTITGTYTDASGRFSLTLSSTENVSIVVSYVNFKLATVEPGENLSIVLQEDILGLEEIAVVAYGSQSKVKLTSSVGIVDGDRFQNMPIQGVNQALQGQTAGVSVFSGNGLPGTGTNVTIRGINSINNNAQPLYVVDGVIIDGGGISSSLFATTQGGGSNPLANINPNDIETVTVLKDASQTALYGSRGANGVIVITTKGGKFGEKTRVNVNYEVGFSQAANEWDLLNTAQYNQFRNAAYFGSFNFADTRADTDWQDVIFRTGFQQRTSVGVVGGNERTRFFISAEAFDQEAYMKGVDFTRFSGRINFEHKINDKLSIGTNLSVTRIVQNRDLTDNAVAGPFSSALLIYPNTPVYSITPGNRSLYEFGSGSNPLANIAVNPLGVLEQDDYIFSSVRVLNNAYLEFRPIEGLTLRTDFGIDFDNADDFFRGLSTSPFTPTGEGSSTKQQSLKYITTTQARYERKINDHRFDVTGLFSFETERSDFTQFGTQDFASDGIRNAGGGATILFYGAGGSEWALFSYLGRLNYDYKDKYLLSATVRVDEGSFFGPASRRGTFPAVAAAWRFGEESFLDGLGWLNEGKIRASYGITGNRPNGNYSYLFLFAPDPSFGYDGLSGSLPSPADAELAWEETTNWEVGLDLSVFNAVNFEMTYYNRKATQLLFNEPLPATTGFTSLLTNADFDLINTGWEFEVSSTNIKKGDFSWTTNFNITLRDNKVEGLPASQTITSGEYRIENGGRVDAWYMVPYLGVDPNTGRGQYLALDGTTTTTLTTNNRRIVGNAYADIEGGLTNTISYKGITLDFLFTFKADYQVFNATKQFLSSYRTAFNSVTDVLTYWNEVGQQTDYPGLNYVRPTSQGGDGQAWASVDHTFWLEDGDHIRLRTVTLSYDLPRNLLEGTGLNSVRVYAQGYNLFVITDYSGIDPETNFNTAGTGLGSIQFSREFLTPPQARTYTFGINLGF